VHLSWRGALLGLLVALAPAPACAEVQRINVNVASGAIVKFSSITGKSATAGRILYPAAKADIPQITKNEAVDLSDGASWGTGADIAVDGG
jgi:NADP-dependent 3-hydroxy acid dehydrogenase YdfG